MNQKRHTEYTNTSFSKLYGNPILKVSTDLEKISKLEKFNGIKQILKSYKVIILKGIGLVHQKIKIHS